jgi:hypothetical protein
LRSTPADKLISRLLGALDRVSDDVTLSVLVRDTPEYVGVTASAYQVLRGRGYVSDSSRFPGGGQRIRVRRRTDTHRPTALAVEEEALPFAPPTEAALEADEQESGGRAVDSL